MRIHALCHRMLTRTFPFVSHEENSCKRGSVGPLRLYSGLPWREIFFTRCPVIFQAEGQIEMLRLEALD